MCRRVAIYLLNPCDSGLIGGYKVQLRNACTKVLLVARLDRRTIMIEDSNQEENAMSGNAACLLMYEYRKTVGVQLAPIIGVIANCTTRELLE